MKRTLVSAAVLALLAGGGTGAFAGPEPNGNNNYGLCTAYTKQQEHRPGGPNHVFAEMADAYDGDMDGDSSEFEAMCQELLAKPAPGSSDDKGNGGGKGGKP